MAGKATPARWTVAFSAVLLATCLSQALAIRPQTSSQSPKLRLTVRSRVMTAADRSRFKVSEELVEWNPTETALVVCDMWDEHWCRGATARIAEMAPRMNEMIQEAREQGVFIIHCPSSCLSFYKDTPMRKMALQAPVGETDVPLQSWCPLDSNREPALPIDDSDGGCDCWPPCQSGTPWKRQIESIAIEPFDAITDSVEAIHLMKQRGIRNVIVAGVHANACVLGRPYSIRQLVYQGLNVVLMRDLTDTMYNPRMKPHVPHVQGTDLVVEHIEKYWCPTITSTDFTGKPPFEFAEAGRPHAVFIVGEREYRTKETLPAFAEEHLRPIGYRWTFLHADEKDGNNFPGLLSLKTADVVIISVRRRSPPREQMELIRDYVEAGKPVVALRTASHAFHTRGQRPDGHEEWQEFDSQVLGGTYRGHHSAGPETQLRFHEDARSHPILSGVSTDGWVGKGSLYQVSPLSSGSQPLIAGAVPEASEEPVAWTHEYQGGRVFYTSLGHPLDFESDSFNRLLVNAIQWATRRN